MKNRIGKIGFIWLMILSINMQQSCKYTMDKKFDTITDRKRALNFYAKKAQETGGAKRESYWIKYFRAFPRDFRTFFQLHCRCYDDTMYLDRTPYSHKFSYNPWGNFHPTVKVVPTIEDIPKDPPAKLKFPEFKVWSYNNYDAVLSEVQKYVPKDIYYRKLISVGTGGFWDSDDITELLLHIMGLVFQDTALSVKILEEKTDDEIASFWFFLYDGPHPTHPDKNKWRNELQDRISKLSPRVAKQMERAYEAVLAEWAGEPEGY